MADDNKDKDKKLSDFGIFFLNGDIDDEICGEAIEFILEANLNQSYERIRMIVNSHGGSCSSGFALIDTMEGSAIPVQTIGIGILASMGLDIFIAGEKGKRILTPNTMIMSHQYFTCAFGKEHELVAARKQHDILTKMVVKFYAKHTKLKTEKAIRQVLLPAHDVWLTAEEALQYGLCDEIKLI